MKKQLIYVLATFMLLLCACAQVDKAITAENEPEERDSVKLVVEEPIKHDEESEEIKIVEPLYKLDASWALQPIGETNPKAVLLTIDDAPDENALVMAKTLKELDAPAIFFVNGHFITDDKDKQILIEIHDMGFAIGNHTETHANLRKITQDEQNEEIISVSDKIEAIIGERPKFFRAPFGINTDYSRALVEQEGMLLMNWSYGYDWEKAYMDSVTLTEIMVNTELLHDGANLLMHDREWTAGALKGIVEGLRAKGYALIDPMAIKGVE